MKRLSQEQVDQNLQALSAQVSLGHRTAQRLSILVELINEDCRIPLAAALRSLYPHSANSDALSKFRKWRSEFNSSVESLKPHIKIEIDQDKQAEPDQRHCWISGGTAALSSDSILAEYNEDAGCTIDINPCGDSHWSLSR